MAKRFLSSIRLATLSSDPESASNGDIYYNSETGKTKFYQNDSWATMPDSLGDLSDISASGLASGQVLTYNGTLSKWEGKEIPPPVIATSSEFPSNPAIGDFFYNNQTEKLYFFINNWNEISFRVIDIDGGNSLTTQFDLVLDGGNSETTSFNQGQYDGGNSTTTI